MVHHTLSISDLLVLFSAQAHPVAQELRFAQHHFAQASFTLFLPSVRSRCLHMRLDRAGPGYVYFWTDVISNTPPQPFA